jgi:hypothetical protein
MVSGPGQTAGLRFAYAQLGGDGAPCQAAGPQRRDQRSVDGGGGLVFGSGYHAGGPAAFGLARHFSASWTSRRKPRRRMSSLELIGGQPSGGPVCASEEAEAGTAMAVEPDAGPSPNTEFLCHRRGMGGAPRCMPRPPQADAGTSIPAARNTLLRNRPELGDAGFARSQLPSLTGRMFMARPHRRALACLGFWVLVGSSQRQANRAGTRIPRRIKPVFRGSRRAVCVQNAQRCPDGE